MPHLSVEFRSAMRLASALFLPVILTLIRPSDETTTNTDTNQHQIEKRGLFYPWLVYSLNAATGILVAIAVPLQHLDRNVFMSYNFEANYNMPGQPADSVPGPPYVRWKLGSTYEDMSVNPAGDASPDDSIARDLKANATESARNEKEEGSERRRRRSTSDSMFTTRRGTYRLIESRLRANGFDGKKCLLRAICESAQDPLIEANGVLGHILHIIFTPSTSLDEDLPPEYGKAENLGRRHSCQKYTRRCDFSLLDSISTFV